MDLDDLNQLHHDQRNHYPEPFRLRIHRAISWLKRAEVLLADGGSCELNRALKINTPHSKTRLSKTAWQVLEKTQSDWDFGFVSLWIAFNAIYARDFNLKTSQDRAVLREFLNRICRLDEDKQIYNLVWQVFSSDLRALVNNRYVFQSFWDFHNGSISRDEFEHNFHVANQKISSALAQQDTDTLLIAVFDRLYTLRNQIVHGGATWNSSANREQVKSACAFLSKILPVFLHVMMNNPLDEAWGNPFYPFVKGD